MTEPSQAMQEREPSPPWVGVATALTMTAIALIGGFLLKRPDWCRYDKGDQFRRDCYTDIQPLYGPRGLPFNDSRHLESFATHGVAYRDVNLEYPALTGLFISAVNAPVKEGDSRGFLKWNVVGLSVFALAGAAAIGAIAARRNRIWMYGLAPAMVAYGFHNWDVLAVGFTALALWAFARDYDGLAGAMLGLGAAAKLYPAFLVPVFLLARRHQSKPLRPLFVSSIFWFAVPNIVVLALPGYHGGISNRLGSLWFPWWFQTKRGPNFETYGYFLSKHFSDHHIATNFWFSSSYGRLLQTGATVVFVALAVWLLRREWLRDQFRPVATCLGVLCLFLITTKVFSPQYAIWLLPFFVLCDIPWYGYAVFVLTDMFVLGAIWALLLATQVQQHDAHVQFIVLEVAVFVRYAGLGFVLWLSRRRGEDLVSSPAYA